MELKKIARGMAAAACLVAGSAHADTMVYDLTGVASQQTDLYNMLMSFQQFNSSLGTLTGVTLDVYSDVSTAVELTNFNTGSNGGKILDVSLGASMSVTAPAASTLAANGTLLVLPLSVGAKAPGPSGAPGQAGSSDSLTLHATHSYGGADLLEFIGNGSLSSQLSVTAASSLQVNNVEADYDTWANGYGKITYTFTALPVPEPETYGMLLAGLGLVAFAAKRSKRAA